MLDELNAALTRAGAAGEPDGEAAGWGREGVGDEESGVVGIEQDAGRDEREEASASGRGGAVKDLIHVDGFSTRAGALPGFPALESVLGMREGEVRAGGSPTRPVCLLLSALSPVRSASSSAALPHLLPLSSPSPAHHLPHLLPRSPSRLGAPAAGQQQLLQQASVRWPSVSLPPPAPSPCSLLPSPPLFCFSSSTPTSHPQCHLLSPLSLPSAAVSPPSTPPSPLCSITDVCIHLPPSSLHSHAIPILGPVWSHLSLSALGGTLSIALPGPVWSHRSFSALGCSLGSSRAAPLAAPNPLWGSARGTSGAVAPAITITAVDRTQLLVSASLLHISPVRPICLQTTPPEPRCVGVPEGPLLEQCEGGAAWEAFQQLLAQMRASRWAGGGVREIGDLHHTIIPVTSLPRLLSLIHPSMLPLVPSSPTSPCDVSPLAALPAWQCMEGGVAALP
ncbi:unnamed protein product [Closterium sp. Naga37s-1]|nr:unnamed protein product [Closterium sp. Naga37s-1]